MQTKFIVNAGGLSAHTIAENIDGFPKDLIDKEKLGEPYIRTIDQENIKKFYYEKIKKQIV